MSNARNDFQMIRMYSREFKPCGCWCAIQRKQTLSANFHDEIFVFCKLNFAHPSFWCETSNLLFVQICVIFERVCVCVCLWIYYSLVVVIQLERCALGTHFHAQIAWHWILTGESADNINKCSNQLRAIAIFYAF